MAGASAASLQPAPSSPSATAAPPPPLPPQHPRCQSQSATANFPSSASAAARRRPPAGIYDDVSTQLDKINLRRTGGRAGPGWHGNVRWQGAASELGGQAAGWGVPATAAQTLSVGEKKHRTHPTWSSLASLRSSSNSNKQQHYCIMKKSLVMQTINTSTSLSAPPLPTAYSRNTSAVRMHHIHSALSQETQLSLTNRATHLCKCNGVADFPQTPLPYVCYHAQFGRFSSKSVVIHRGEPPKLGSVPFPR